MFNPENLEGLGGLSLTSYEGNRASFTSEAGDVFVTAYAEGIFRFELGDLTLADYGIVIAEEEPLSLSVEETDAGYACRCGEYTLMLDAETLAVSLENESGPILLVTEDAHFNRPFRLPPLAKTEEGWFLTLGLPMGTAVYGGGEQYGQINRRGLLMDLWNEDALGVNSNLAYKNCPFWWSPDGWGLFLNSPAYIRAGVGYPQWSNQSFCLDIHEGRVDMFLIAADAPAAILEKYTRLTGRSPEVPLWSLGLWLSKAYYLTPDDTLAAAQGMRDNGIPCDVITIDGRAWQDTDTRFFFEWDLARYDDPKAFCDKLKDLNYKICVWEYPLVSLKNSSFAMIEEKGYFLKDEDGNTAVFEFDPGAFDEEGTLTQLPDSAIIDFTNPEAYEFWKEQHYRLFEEGVDSIKADFGEQVQRGMYAFNGDEGTRLHNGYALLYNRCVYEAGRGFYGDQALNWSRSGWAGSQCLPMQWAGDTGSTWSGLAASIMGGLSWGMSGCPHYSTDIGGFYGEQPTPELFARWTQAAVFCSHMRYHGQGAREPWAFGPEAEAVCREFIDLRYKLIPYLQKTCAEASETGLPVMRSMPLAFPDEKDLASFEMQYMLGNDVFVAPVLRSGGRVTYRLPSGTWYNMWTGEAREGGATIEETMPLERIPVYVRDGAVLSFGPVVTHTGEITAENRIEAHVVYGEAGDNVPQDGKPVLSPEDFFQENQGGEDASIFKRL